MTWANAWQIATTKPNVMLFAMTRTPQRLKQFTMLGPVAIGMTDLYALEDSSVKIETLEDAKKVKYIGVYLSAVEDQILSREGFSNLIRYTTPRKAALSLLNRKTELWCNANLTAHSILKKVSPSHAKIKRVLTIGENRLYLAFSKGTDRHEILRWYRALIAVKRSGEFKDIYNKWLPDDQPPRQIELLGLSAQP